jgi:nucleoside-diphosphate-sugar epimerase
LLKGVDSVIHLAAITDAPSSFENRDRVEEVNFAGTERVARACAEAGCALFFVSTTSVYGTQESVVDEECSEAELKPQSPYAESKLKSERMLGELGRTRGLRFVTCRFGTIFGVSPGMRFHTAINKFVWQACMGVPITVWRTALDQKRPYLDLGDAVGAIRFVLERNLFDRATYNMVTVNTSVAAIVEIIRSEIPDAEVRFVDSPIMNQLSYEVATRKSESAGIAYRGDLRRSILETIETIRSARSLLAE